MATQTAAIARGQAPFKDPSAGGGGRAVSCNSCHVDGGPTGQTARVTDRDQQFAIPTLVGAAGRFPRYTAPYDAVTTLQQMNNYGNRVFMGGKGFELNSPEAWALEAHVASLSNGKDRFRRRHLSAARQQDIGFGPRKRRAHESRGRGACSSPS